MRSDRPLLQEFDTVELAVDPFVPEVPGNLLLLAHSEQLALRNLMPM